MPDSPDSPRPPRSPRSPTRAGRRSLLAAALAAGLARAAAAATAGRAAQPADAAAGWVWQSRFAHALADWPGQGAGWGARNRAFQRDSGATPGSDAPLSWMRVALQRGGIDPASMRRRGLPPSGTGFKTRLLPGGSDAATLRYRLRFAPQFDFVRGGKLPGLFAGTGPSGGQQPDGHDGVSLRLMWRERGRGEVYAYLPGQQGVQGHGLSLLRAPWPFQPGRWHEVVQAVQMNTPGQADGSLAWWLDGRLAGQLGGLRLRDTAALRLEGVFFDVFFGGNDESWAPPADTHVDFADFALAADAGGPR